MTNKLASYAVNEKNTLGRVHPYTSGIEINDKESIYSKDARRIMYSECFNRLRDKTQVFPVTDEKTSYLSRMLHSFQVAKLSKETSESLSLNGELSWALGLLHDIGHAPFGHLGQDVLNQLMQPYGGFEHNFQAIRIVDIIEKNNPGYDGLNLTFEVREGLLKHCSKENAKLMEQKTIENNEKYGTKLPNIAERHLNGENASLEAQLVNIADSVSYIYSDLQDAFRNGILTLKDLYETPSFENAFKLIIDEKLNIGLPTVSSYDLAVAKKDYKSLRVMNASVDSLINIMLKIATKDLKMNSMALIQESGIQTLDDVKNYKGFLVTFTDKQYAIQKELKTFSRERIYLHPKIHGKRFEQAEVLVGLFNAYMKEPDLIGGIISENESLARNVCDHIAGMTDKFAIYSYNDLKLNSPDLLMGKYHLPKGFEISPDKKTEKKRLNLSH